MPKVKIYDVVAKKSFTTDKFTIKKIKGRNFAFAKSPFTGKKAVVIVSADFAKKNK